ncbi:MAG: nucleotidyltransferase family protein [Isosphaeraceae bacterium]|nr:nucleotidyltransferase family protein [Isosphaeraceae bacterium]
MSEKNDAGSTPAVKRPTIAIDHQRLAGFCRRHGVRRLALFGSALRDDFRPESDLDVLVEFEPGRTPGLAFFALQDELSALLGRTVDWNTPASLSPLFREEVLRSAKVLYDAG